jgi:hypothetical protein
VSISLFPYLKQYSESQIIIGKPEIGAFEVDSKIVGNKVIQAVPQLTQKYNGIAFSPHI